MSARVIYPSLSFALWRLTIRLTIGLTIILIIMVTLIIILVIVIVIVITTQTNYSKIKEGMLWVV